MEVKVMDYSEQIRILLVKCGKVTQVELASRLGISRQSLSKKMKNNSFTVNDLEKIAEAVGCSLVIEFRKEGKTIA